MKLNKEEKKSFAVKCRCQIQAINFNIICAFSNPNRRKYSKLLKRFPKSKRVEQTKLYLIVAFCRFIKNVFVVFDIPGNNSIQLN